MGSLSQATHYDTIVIGAGLHGLSYARAHLRLSPERSIVLLDKHRTIGGVWSTELLYPTLKTNNKIGTYQFTDFPVLKAGLDPKYGLKEGVHIPGEAVFDYLNKMSDREGITERVRLRTKVLRAREELVGPTGGEKVLGWRVFMVDMDDESKETEMTCARFVVCTGACAEPAPLLIPGADPEKFGKPCYSFSGDRRKVADLFDSPSISHATVLGGGKSAYDLVQSLAAEGKKVSWIIRKSGRGAQWMANSTVLMGPFKVWLEAIVLSRPVTWFSPCIFGSEDGFGFIRWLLHGTRLGRAFTKGFWDNMSADTLKQTGLGDGKDGCEECLRPLVPRVGMRWQATQAGVLNFDVDVKDYVRSGQVVVQEKDIERLEPGGVVRFTDGESVQTDAFFAVTGWRYNCPIELEPAQATLGTLGHPTTQHTPSETALWSALEDRADAHLLAQLPELAASPLASEPKGQLPYGMQTEAALSKDGKAASPWRLYRTIAPPGQAAGEGKVRNLVFLGALQTFHAQLRSELTAMWAWAYFNRELEREPGSDAAMTAMHETDYADLDGESSAAGKTREEKRVLASTALSQRYFAWRYPVGPARHMPEMLLDALPFYDLMLNDLGVNNWRRGRGKGWLAWFREVFTGYVTCEEYEGCLKEFQQRVQERKEEREREAAKS